MLLHLSNDYSGSTVYKNLIKQLDTLGFTQIVYNPIRDLNRVNKNRILFTKENSEIIYSTILNNHTDKIFYKIKLNKIFYDIENKIDLHKIRIIHAHTWYSDGGVAFKIYKKYNIPYIITIRNTDLNVFQKYLLHERSFGCEVLKNASKVILISASYKNRVLNLNSLKSILLDLESKIYIIPNGVDSFWLEHSINDRLNKIRPKDFKILYIGNFNKGKNVRALQEAVALINKENHINLKLHIVGGGGKDSDKVLETVKSNSNIMKYHGKVFDKKELLEIYKNNDIFAMPSKNETFGLVYVEAMLQGLPILYTQDEGIDGFYKDTIGEKVSKQANVVDIKDALLLLIDNFEKYNIPIDEIKRNHNWELIANKYLKIYSVCL